MKIAQITEKNEKELTQLIADQRKQLADVYVEMRTKKVNNVKQIAAIKKTIARALTIQRQNEISKLEAQDE